MGIGINAGPGCNSSIERDMTLSSGTDLDITTASGESSEMFPEP